MTQERAEDLVKRGHRVTVITGWPNHPGGALSLTRATSRRGTMAGMPRYDDARSREPGRGTRPTTPAVPLMGKGGRGH